MEMGIDITDRKQAEEALKEANETLEQRVAERTEALRRSENDLAHAQAVAHTGSWRLDVRRNELLWSDETHRMFGISKGTPLTYEAFLGTVHPEDRQYLDQKWTAALRGDPYDIEHRIVVGSEVKWVRERAEMEFDPQGTPLGGFGTVQDITERKRAGEAILRAKEEWERTFDTVPDLVAILDDQHRIVRVNRAMADRLGVTPDQCIGLRCHDAVHGTPEVPEFCPHVLTCKDGRQHVAEVHEPHLGGDFLVSTTPLCDSQGQLIGSVHVARDITERKRAEESLRQHAFELQQLTETLEQRVQERTAELQKANEALRHLSSRLLSAQEEERKRIAGEIHDTLGASLSAIKFKVENTLRQIETSDPGLQSLQSITPVIQESIEECRRIQMDLRPSMLDDLGLLPTLSWFLRRFQTIYSEVQIEREIEIEEGDVPQPLKIVVFRVTQEAMNNTAKHSHANLVRLSLRRIEDRIELVLQDNGRGFHLEKMPGRESVRRDWGLQA